MRAKKPGTSSVARPTTGTPRVSRTSSVRGTSRIDFGPAQTTSTGVRASSSRSAETSRLDSPPRWTPPMPPVAKTRMPASAGGDHGGADRGARPGARLERRREVVPRGLDHRSRRRQGVDLVLGQADHQPPTVDGDRGRHGALATNGGLGGPRHLHVARRRQPVRDERGLERHDRRAGGERFGHFGGEAQHRPRPWRLLRDGGPVGRRAGHRT